jgi:hypothetical protein
MDGASLFFPPEFFEDKTKWEKVHILGRTFNAPANYRGYLAYYYGEDYMKEDKNWHWTKAECVKQLEEINKEL